MKGITVKTEKYEGPLELLYELVEKNKIDIYDIPISLLADQYMDAVSLFVDRDMDSMSEFILMGAHLLEIKSRMMLGRHEKDEEDGQEDPRMELARRLAEYKRFKQAAQYFGELGLVGGMEFYKGAEEELRPLAMPSKQNVINAALNGVTIEQLYRVFMDTLARRELFTDKIRGGFNSVKKDVYTIAEKMFWLRTLLKDKKRLLFSELFDGAADKAEIIVTFLALLELIRQGVLVVSQAEEFGEIVISG